MSERRDRAEDRQRGRRDHPLLPRGHHRQRRSARPALSLEQIVTAGMAIADREGIEAVTMRSVARELGAGAMSLYWHVRDKTELFQLMLVEAIRQASPPATSTGNWREDLASIARTARRNFLAHPWIFDIIGTDMEGLLAPESLIIHPGMLEHIENTMAKTRTLPFDFATRAMVGQALDDLTLGFTAGEVMQRRLEKATGLTESERQRKMAPMVQEILATGMYPAFAEYVQHDEELPSMDERFEFALNLLLDGVAARVEAARDDEPTEPSEEAAMTG